MKRYYSLPIWRVGRRAEHAGHGKRWLDLDEPIVRAVEAGKALIVARVVEVLVKDND